MCCAQAYLHSCNIQKRKCSRCTVNVSKYRHSGCSTYHEHSALEYSSNIPRFCAKKTKILLPITVGMPQRKRTNFNFCCLSLLCNLQKYLTVLCYVVSAGLLRYFVPLISSSKTGQVFRVTKQLWKHRCRINTLRISSLRHHTETSLRTYLYFNYSKLRFLYSYLTLLPFHYSPHPLSPPPFRYSLFRVKQTVGLL